MRTWSIAAVALIAAACAPAAPDVRPPAESETLIEGMVTQVEDGGYPQFTVTVQPEGGEPVALYLNAESGADLGGGRPESFAGAPAIIYYTSTDELNLIDLVNAAGASVIHEAGSVASTDGETITGTLSGADAVTAGDLPDEITVTDAQGIARTFEFYIDDAIVALNGQQVTARYRPGVRNEITLMRARE